MHNLGISVFYTQPEFATSGTLYTSALCKKIDSKLFLVGLYINWHAQSKLAIIKFELNNSPVNTDPNIF